jgi:hypothetical protein
MLIRRPAIFIGMTVLLFSCYVFLGSLGAQSDAQNVTGPSEPSPLAGNNSVSGLEIKQTKL